MTSKIQVEGVAHRYQRRGEVVPALRSISLSVEAGEFVSIVGPSGCGKTTLLFSIAGFIRPSEGRILLDGSPITGPGPDRGVVFQSFALFNWLTVRENVEFGLTVRGDPPEARRARSTELLAMVGLSRFSERYPYELSGGMKQRTAIARALAPNPDVLLMDEPFGALDAQSRDMMQEELVRIWQASGKTVLFVTHSIDEAIFLSSRVIVFSSRPGSIKHVLDVQLPDPRYDPHVRTSRHFVEIKDSILDMVREETLKQFAEEEGQL
jgi:ABC-type nitrate/sulfonate/bicarbonate transport system ATPase subunit